MKDEDNDKLGMCRKKMDCENEENLKKKKQKTKNKEKD